MCKEKRTLERGGEGVGGPELDLEPEEPTDTRVLQDERGMGEPGRAELMGEGMKGCGVLL